MSQVDAAQLVPAESALQSVSVAHGFVPTPQMHESPLAQESLQGERKCDSLLPESAVSPPQNVSNSAATAMTTPRACLLSTVVCRTIESTSSCS